MSKMLKFLANFLARSLAPLFLLSLFSLGSPAFAEPPDDVGTGKPCPECSTITSSHDDVDDTVPDDVGTGSTGSWWDLLLESFRQES